MKCTGNSSSSHDKAADDLFMTSDAAESKTKQALFLDGMDAFDNFLQLVAKVEDPNGRLQIAMQMEEGLVDDDETSFFSDDSDDESPRVIPVRGVRRDHSGDLERLFQPKCIVLKNERGRGDPTRQDKNQVTDGSNPTKGSNKKPTSRVRDVTAVAVSGEHGRRTRSCTNIAIDQAAFDLGENDNKATRILSRHSAHDQSKSDESTGRRRRVRRVTPPSSMIQKEAQDFQNMEDPPFSPPQVLRRPESRGELRRSRGDLSSSEHSRPRMRRDTLYATKRPTTSGTSDHDRALRTRPNSEIDFQKAAAAAAKKRQSAGRRISGGTIPLSPSRHGSSSKESLRCSTAFRNSCVELSELSQPRLPRSNTSGTNLGRSAGPRRSFNNLNLVGVYSDRGASSNSPIRTVDDLRRSLKKNGGRHDIDDLVVKMTSNKASYGCQTKQGNATWN